MSDEDEKIEFENPTSDMVGSPEFNAVWDLIKSWEIKIPGFDSKNADGTHVKVILDAIKDSRPSTVREIVRKLKYKSLGNKTKENLIYRLDQILNNTII